MEFFSFRTVTNMFIMNLAAADLLVLVFCLPATVVQDVTKTWFFGLILCKFVNYIQVYERGLNFRYLSSSD